MKVPHVLLGWQRPFSNDEVDPSKVPIKKTWSPQQFNEPSDHGMHRLTSWHADSDGQAPTKSETCGPWTYALMELLMIRRSEARPANPSVNGRYLVPRIYIIVALAIAAWVATIGLGRLLWSLAL